MYEAVHMHRNELLSLCMFTYSGNFPRTLQTYSFTTLWDFIAFSIRLAAALVLQSQNSVRVWLIRKLCSHNGQCYLTNFARIRTPDVSRSSRWHAAGNETSNELFHLAFFCSIVSVQEYIHIPRDTETSFFMCRCACDLVNRSSIGQNLIGLKILNHEYDLC